MNGRVYDPVIGRFLSPDPNVQDPNNQQSLNRYSYVWNNPLSFTDPSGYFLSGFFHWLGHHWRMLVAVVVAIVASVVAQQWESWGWVAAMAGGFASGLIASDGNLQDGLIGAAAALAFYGIGSQFQGVRMGAQEFVEKVVEHGMVGGLQSVAEGGRFFSGFLSAALPESASLATGNYSMFGTGGAIDAGKVVAAATLGGTAAMLGGGKFANGAVTGAFSYAFGSVARDMQNGASFGEAMLDLAGKVWALPNTVIGLAIGGVSYGAGWAGYGLGLVDVAPSISIGNNAIQFENIPFGNGALTVGNTIIYGGGTAPSQMGNLYGDRRYLNVGLHEMGHTYQYQAYGPFFLPAYFLRGGISATNPFEQGANNYAAGGSWRP